MIETVTNPNAAAPAGAYSPALKFGDFVMVSGQGPLSPDGEILSGTIEEETRKTLENVKTLLDAAGARLDQVVKCNCYLADIGDFAAFNGVYKEFFGAGPYPCRTTVEGGLLGIKVEIDAMAYIA